MHTKSLFFIYSIASLFLCIILNFSHRTSHPRNINPSPSSMAKIKDTFYISHGSPTLSIDDSLPARHFLKSFQHKVLHDRPAAILIVSGHWETSDPTVNAVSGPCETIHDFYGFPDQMYDLRYPAPGSPQLAAKVKQLLEGSGIGPVHVDRRRGLDHGAWVPLMLMYPAADIPVCQLSVQTHRDAAHHYRVGQALAPLKDEGVLIVGSGAATHNLRKMGRAGGGVAGWAEEFDSWIKAALEEGRYEDVNDYEAKAPHARVAHPRPDHFYPLHVAMGAAGENTRGYLVHHSWSYQTLSYASYKFTDKE
ncbi:Extradiol ring-cleavage dioxygenase [Striga hermonthica]|uniref:Extradiol ring-cleavage dioxygenase n=1 Tax=Striga hermonthica TaxID=68872 RepID=A0A9N7R544_STRHE|nr:Extradiol ring-cleavage dioxygenase [Striga hermonthica]